MTDERDNKDPIIDSMKSAAQSDPKALCSADQPASAVDASTATPEVRQNVGREESSRRAPSPLVSEYASIDRQGGVTVLLGKFLQSTEGQKQLSALDELEELGSRTRRSA